MTDTLNEAAVYFGEREGLIKIGLSKRPISRCKAMGCEFLGWMPGDYAKEQGIHRIFESHHHDGEWFRDNDALREFIKRFATTQNAPAGNEGGEIKDNGGPAQALERAIGKAGSAYKLAQLLGCPRQTVYKWVKEGRVLSRSSAVHVEQETGVSRHELRPDLFGERV